MQAIKPRCVPATHWEDHTDVRQLNVLAAYYCLTVLPDVDIQHDFGGHKCLADFRYPHCHTKCCHCASNLLP